MHPLLRPGSCASVDSLPSWTWLSPGTTTCWCTILRSGTCQDSVSFLKAAEPSADGARFDHEIMSPLTGTVPRLPSSRPATQLGPPSLCPLGSAVKPRLTETMTDHTHRSRPMRATAKPRLRAGTPAVRRSSSVRPPGVGHSRVRSGRLRCQGHELLVDSYPYFIEVTGYVSEVHPLCCAARTRCAIP